MDKKGFKIGDKVKLRPGYIKSFHQGTKVGRVISFSNSYIRVKYGAFDECPYLPREIEREVRVGEQLEFSFMKGN